MLTDGGASTKTPVLLSGVKPGGGRSVSESLITLCHLNPLSAELVPGSEAQAHTCVLLSVLGARSDSKTQDFNLPTVVSVSYFMMLFYHKLLGAENRKT